MSDVLCAQCAQSFVAQGWTRTCPHCGTDKATRCEVCGTPISLPARMCVEHSPLPTGVPHWVPTAAPSARPTGPLRSWSADVLPAPRKHRRRWPLAVLGLMALGGAAAGGAFALGLFESKLYPKSWDPRVTDLVAFVERERGLEFKHPVYIDFLSAAEFRRQVTQRDDPTAVEKAELAQETAVLRAVGLLRGDVDLLKIGEELVGDGAIGLYRPDAKRIAVRGETLDDERRSTLVHELTHALQDQHFDIGDVERGSSGAELAFTAVVEADADDVERAWYESLSEDARKAVDAAQESTSEGADFEGVPRVFVEMLGFPYAFGPDLLRAVVADKGQVGRDSLFTHPPISEEEVVLPGTYLAGQKVKYVATPKLAAGEVAIKDTADDFGMVSLLVVLAERIDYTVAWAAVQGWAGDASIGFERGGVACIRIDVAFDEAAQAERFEAAFDQWSNGFPATHSRTDRSVLVESCDPGTNGPAGRADDHVSGIQGLALRREVMESLATFGVPAERTACVADGTLQLITANRFVAIDDLLTANPNSRAIGEIQAATARATTACGG